MTRINCIPVEELRPADGVQPETFPDIADEYWNDCEPTKEAMAMNRERIAQP